MISGIAMVIRREQVKALGEHCAEKRVEEMANRIRADFKREVAGINPDDFSRTVKRLVAKMRSLGFRQQPYIYRLVCWGVFLGDDYLHTLGDGSLADVVLSDAAERERFDKIVAVLTASPE